MKNINNKLAILLAVVAIIVTAGKLSYARLSNPVAMNTRWLATLNGGFAVAGTSNTNQANQVALSMLEVPTPSVVTGLCYSVGAVQAGNVRLGLYGPIVSDETVTGSPLVLESASTAQGVAANAQCLNVATTSIPSGRYYVAYQGDDPTGTFYRHSATYAVEGWTRTFNMAYGAFPTTATTSAIAAANIPAFKVRLIPNR